MTSRPVQWPRTLTRGLSTAVTIRRVIGASFIRSLECTRGRDDVEPAEHLLGLVEGAVVEDVDLDALEQPERSPRDVLIAVDDRRAAREPLGG